MYTSQLLPETNKDLNLSEYPTDDKNHSPAHFLTLHVEGYMSVATSFSASAKNALFWK